MNVNVRKESSVNNNISEKMYMSIKIILLQNTTHSSIFGQTRISFAKNFVFSHSQLPVFVLYLMKSNIIPSFSECTWKRPEKRSQDILGRSLDF